MCRVQFVHSSACEVDISLAVSNYCCRNLQYAQLRKIAPRKKNIDERKTVNKEQFIDYARTARKCTRKLAPNCNLFPDEVLYFFAVCICSFDEK